MSTLAARRTPANAPAQRTAGAPTRRFTKFITSLYHSQALVKMRQEAAGEERDGERHRSPQIEYIEYSIEQPGGSHGMIHFQQNPHGNWQRRRSTASLRVSPENPARGRCPAQQTLAIFFAYKNPPHSFDARAPITIPSLRPPNEASDPETKCLLENRNMDQRKGKPRRTAEGWRFPEPATTVSHSFPNAATISRRYFSLNNPLPVK